MVNNVNQDNLGPGGMIPAPNKFPPGPRGLKSIAAHGHFSGSSMGAEATPAPEAAKSPEEQLALYEVIRLAWVVEGSLLLDLTSPCPKLTIAIQQLMTRLCL